jgi:polysaccharide pyruvyl transferase WcaK-like protein
MLIGFEYESSNKGCEALSYAIMAILSSIMSFEPLEIVNINIHDSMGEIPSIYPNINFVNLRMRVKSPEFWKRLSEELKDCDAALDITHGDSFSDIYGSKWFATTTLVKTYMVNSKIPFILMPQTYGPFKAKWAASWAKYVIIKADKVYTRDNISYTYLRSLGIKKDIMNTLDLAFALPYKKNNEYSSKIRIGINVSGLLWNDCTNGNVFKLNTDYCCYCRWLIAKLLQDEKYEVILVPHVLCDSREGMEFFENDSRAIRILMKEFPSCTFPNDFKSAIDVKNYIANLDILVAARMHASIAAYSSGVAVVPFAYSRKFEGVYEDLSYPYVINAMKLNTSEAIARTLEYIEFKNKLFEDEKPGRDKIFDIQSSFLSDFENLIQSFHKNKKN